MANRLQKYASSVTPLKALTALELGAKAINTLPVRDGLPWNDFARIYTLRLGSYTTGPDRQWNCVYSDTKEDIRRLGCVMMELMDGYVKDGGSVGLDDPSRWSPEAVQFLGATTSVSSAKDLLLVRLFPWNRHRKKSNLAKSS
ncbi:hypothetical protein MY4038_003030 [Beauveria bassiana]